MHFFDLVVEIVDFFLMLHFYLIDDFEPDDIVVIDDEKG